MRKSVLSATLMSGGGDTVAPTVTIASNVTNPTTTNPATVTITFSEVVTGFTVGDITIGGGGSLASFSTADNKVFTVSWTMITGENTLDIAAGVCTDAAGNTNQAATQYIMSYGARLVYVATTGNDTTGNGAVGTPYATSGKAVSVAQNGDLILITDGTYEETFAGTYGNYTKTLTSYAVVMPLLGSAGNVVLTGSTFTGLNIWVTDLHYFKFKNLTFTKRSDNTAPIMNWAGANSNVQFIGCTFLDIAGSNTQGIEAGCSDGVLADILFSSCVFMKNSISDLGTLLKIVNNSESGAGSVSGITVQDSTFYGGQICIHTSSYNAGVANGVTDFLIDGCDFENQGVLSIEIGDDVDSVAVTPHTTATIQNCTIVHPTGGHGVILGKGSKDCVVDNVTITQSYDIGIVAKASSGHEIKNCHVVSGSTCALMARGAIGVNFHNNTLTGAPTTGLFRLERIATGDVKSQTITFVDNVVTASGAGKCLSWLGDTDDLGGGVCDRNAYSFVSGSVGDVRGTNGIATLAALQAAWAGYGDETNDDNSTVTDN